MRDLLRLAPALSPPPWGACGQFLSTRSVFLLTAALALPADLCAGAHPFNLVHALAGSEDDFALRLAQAEAGAFEFAFFAKCLRSRIVHIGRAPEIIVINLPLSAIC